MSSVGHLVARFQVKHDGDHEGDGAEEEGQGQTLTSPAETATVAAPASEDNASVAAPSGRNLKKPAPPGKKPVKPPPGVAMRKQESDRQSPPLRRQNSTSFTTEDLDLFQRPRHITDQDQTPPPEENTVERRSRKDSVKRSDGQSEKRRSKSVGAFAHGGLTVQPLPEKPKPPSKPKLANKPLVGRPIPASKPAKPTKPTVEKVAPDLPPKKSQVVLRHQKSDSQKAGQPRSSRPASGTRPTSVSKPTAGSRHSQRPGSLTKSQSKEEHVSAHGTGAKTAAKGGNVKLRSPVKTPSEDKPTGVRSRPAPGTRQGPGHSDAALPRSKSRPTSGVNARTPSYMRPVVAKTPSEDSVKKSDETGPKAPPRRPSTKGPSAKRSSSLKQKGKPESAAPKVVVKESSTEVDPCVLPVGQRRHQFADKKTTHGKITKVPPKPSEKPAHTTPNLQQHVSPKVSPTCSPLLPPKISPKPSALRGSPNQSPLPSTISPKASPFSSPRVSPSASPAVSPKPTRAKLSPFVASPIADEAKAEARKTIISALSGISKRFSELNSVEKEEESSSHSRVESAGNHESQENSKTETLLVDASVAKTDELPRSDGESETNRKTSVGDLMKKVDQLARLEDKSEDRDRSKGLDANRKVSDKTTENLEESRSDLKISDEQTSPSGSEKKTHHHDHGKLHLDKYNEESLNKAVAKAAVGKVLLGPNQRKISKPHGLPPPPPPPTSTPPAKTATPLDPPEVSNGEATSCALSQAPEYENPPSPSSSSSQNLSKHLKSGLDAKGQDLPVAQLIKELKEVEKAKPSRRVSSEDGLSRAKRSPLPLRVYNNQSSPSSSDSERKDADSNDADDEDEQTASTKQLHATPCYVKSFSTGQPDIDAISSPVSNKRPASITSAVSTESASSSETQSIGKTKSKKSGVLERLRKLSIGFISNDNAEDDQSKKVGNAVFYHDEEISHSAASKRETVFVGKTRFYSSDTASVDEIILDTNEPEKEISQVLEGERKSAFVEKTPILPERARNGIRKSLSDERPVSEVLVENENYDTSQPYENIQFGPVYEGIEVQKNKAGRNDLYNSSQSSVDQPSEPGVSMDNQTSSEHSKASTPSPEDNANLTNQPDIMDNEPVYHEIGEVNIEPDQGQIYENVAFPDPYAKRSIWRRRTLRRKTKKRQREEDVEVVAEELEDEIENFSDSEDSFTSDSFTDESDIEEKQGITLYAPLERPKPGADEESDLSPMTRLQRIANELLTTERAYVQRLFLIDQVFHFRVVIENRAHHMFPDDVIPQMFSNIKSVYQFHNDFLLPQLEKRMSEWSQTPKIGDLMKKFAPFLKLYSEYVKNFDHAMNTISTWSERSQQFANILSELHKKKECGNLTLQHHMLEPIQRVPRYELLLKDYLKHLPEGSEDEEDTKKALELVTTAASHSNEAMRKIEKFRKLLELNEKFGGTVDLIDPTRELVKEGKITKISARNGLHFERYLFLFNDMLLLCQTHVMGLIHSYRIKNVLEVDGMQVLEGDNLETPYTFYIRSKTKTIEVHTSTAGEKMEWFVTIDNVIADYTRKQMSRQAGRKAMEAFKEEQLGYRAPTWVKDQNTSMCMECGSPFTMLKRRHHCRCCGIVVCHKCSSQKAPLPYLGGKADRVCSKCYHTLSGRAGHIPPDTNTHIHRTKGVLQVKGSDPSLVSGMMSMSVDKKNWEKRWFALHENYVLYSFKAPQDLHAITSLPLPGYEAEAATKDDHLDRDNVIKLFHKNQKKVYYFATETNSSAKWLLCLDYATRAELPPDPVSSSAVQ